MPPREFSEKLERLMTYCEEVGREVERDEAGVILRTYVDRDRDRAPEVRDRDLKRRELTGSMESFQKASAFGTPAECVETVQRYADAGCTRFVLMPVGPASERVEQLERYRRYVIAEFTRSA